MFLQLHRSCNNKPIRVAVKYIESYFLKDDEKSTELWVNDGIVDILETPEQIDQLLAEDYIYVKKAVNFPKAQTALDTKQDAPAAQEALPEQEVQV